MSEVENQLDAVADLSSPPSVKWSSPWNWVWPKQSWKRSLIITGFLFAGYLVSPVIVVPFVNRFGPPPFATAVIFTYLPLQFAAENYEPIGWCYDESFRWADAAINACAGPLPGTCNAPLPEPPPPPDPVEPTEI